MLKVRVITCLTVKNKRLVKSVQFSDHRNIGSYISAVRVFNARDVDELILLDLDASTHGIVPSLLEEVSKECFMPVAMGGGVRTLADVQVLLAAGADKVVVNSFAVTAPELIGRIAQKYGNQCVVVSMDVRGVGPYEVVIEGGKTSTGLDPVEWARRAESLGAGEIFLTSIERDGMMRGYELDLIRAVSEAVRIPVIASGGAGSPNDCVLAIQAGASAVAAASIFQYTQVTPRDIKRALAHAGFPTRML